MYEIDSMNSTSPAYRAAHTAPGEFESFLNDLKKMAKTDPGKACDAIRQREAIMALDLPGEFGGTMDQAAQRVRAKMLVMVSPEDHTVNPAPAVAFANYIHAPVIFLDSPCGHMSLTCTTIGPYVAQFLADPGSVRSMTLHEPGPARQ